VTAGLREALLAREGIVCAVGAGGKKTTLLRLVLGHPGRVALTATTKIVCAVGAGGKKTTLLRLVLGHPGRVALTATTKIVCDLGHGLPGLLSWPDGASAADVLGPSAGLRLYAWAGEPSRSERLRGADPGLVREAHVQGGFDATYVKADGARMRFAKAHDPDEPLLVPGASTVLLLASLRVLGRPLDEASVHHAELFAAMAGLPVGQPVTVEGLATVLLRQLAMLAAMTAARRVVVLNMADDDRLLGLGREVADALLGRHAAADRIAVTAMLADEPLRELIAP